MKRIDVVETVTGRSMAELVAARDRAVAELVELRLDGVADLDVARALFGRRTRVIATCRAAWEGGAFRGSEEERLRILSDAGKGGAEFVDIEWKADRRNFSVPPSATVVLSSHDFSGTPADLEDRVRAMRSEEGAIVKVAVTTHRLRDVVTLRDAMAGGGRQVAIAMGPKGLVTRLCPWLFGSCWTFGGAAAPGQMPPRDLIDLYRIESGSSDTRIYGITGAPLAHSASPAMHNTAFAAVGLNAVYVPLESDDADEMLSVAEALCVQGLSVTAPLKPAMFNAVDDMDALSRQIGAVNTLKREGSAWVGRNFDVAGFLAPLYRRAQPLKGRRAVVLGAGGTARTAVWALRSEGAQIEIAARRRDAGAALAAEFGAEPVAWPPAPGWDLLVNTTPVGTWPNVGESPLDRSQIGGRTAYDLVYNPAETQLLAWAREAGAEVIGGREMLVGQAVQQFEWWTGEIAPMQEMDRAAAAFIERGPEFAS